MTIPNSRSQRSSEPTQTKGVPSDLVEVARIAGAHGVRGWLRIQPFSSDSTLLASTSNWWLKPPVSPLADAGVSGKTPRRSGREVAPVRVLWAREHGSAWLTQFEDMTDRDEALALKGYTIWISRSDFPKLDNDEFYWIDLVGCEVYQTPPNEQQTDLSERLGVVDQVIDSPAHCLLSVMRQVSDDAGEWVSKKTVKGKPVMTLIPFVAVHVPRVDLENRRIWVDWPEDF